MPAILALVPPERALSLTEAMAAAELEASVVGDAAEFEAALASVTPELILVSDSWMSSPVVVAALGDQRWISVLLAEQADAEVDGAEQLRVVDAALSDTELTARIAFAAHGLALGVQPASDLGSLVGDVAHTPVLELVRGLCRRKVACAIRLEGGVIHLGQGDVLAARSRRAAAIKAFCRLARRRTGTATVEPTEPHAREIGMGLEQLLLRALEDAQETPPDPRSALRPFQSGLYRAAGLLDYQRELLQAIDEAPTVGDLLDALPWPDGLTARRLARLVEAKLVEVIKPNNATVIVTDSTADLPGRVVNRLGINVVPLTVHFGKTAYRDGVDIDPARFYELLERGTDHPRSEPPSTEVFASLFAERLTTQDVVAVLLSSKLSLTVAHAGAAVAGVLGSKPRAGAQVQIVDGTNISAGTGLLAMAGARMAERGASATDIADRLRTFAPRIHTLFVVDTLDYLVRGGRIGAARGFVGKLLGIKPILGVVGGEITAVDKVRGGRAAHPRIIELLAQRVDPARPIVAAVAHAKAPVWAERLRLLIEGRFQVLEMVVTDMGPVIGTHAGPGSVGTAVFQPTDEEWALIQPLEGELNADGV